MRRIFVDLKNRGLDKNTTVSYHGARWRFAGRWSTTFTCSTFDERGGGEVSDTFNFYGQVYFAGATLDAFVRLDDKFGERLGVNAGAQYTHIDLKHDGGSSPEQYDVKLPGAVAYLGNGF